MPGKQTSKAEREAQIIKRAVLLVGALILLLLIGALSVMINRYIDKQEAQNHERIYGVWVEQNVPKFARDRFIVREEGIYIKERIVDTQYTFNGSELRYEYEAKEYVYKVKEEEETLLLLRVEPVHYLSTFQLEGTESPVDTSDEVTTEDEPAGVN